MFIMNGEENGLGGLDEPLNLHVCITKIMKPLIVIVPLLVMFTIIYIQVEPGGSALSFG